ncbi:MAG TPA: hypothetical protein VHE81_11150, partial [Lacipirellulaceae bacterium]|nr:hypothetical protein [Lacipirellulaceae bacterium]
MIRHSQLFCLALTLGITSTVRADVTYGKAKEGDTDIEVVRMTVTPAAEPVPALRYRLVPRDFDLKAGNRVIYYYRAELELDSTMKAIRAKFDEEKELGHWYGTGDEPTPISKLPLDKVRKANAMFEPLYRGYLQPAFELSGCDWELGVERLRGPDVISFLLPEFQNSREIARMLSLRTRLAIAEHRYADAVETMQQNYRLGSDVARVPFLVCGLIGIAVDSITNHALLDLIANPDSPNMYWAIGELPQPPIDLRLSVRFEMDFGPRMFPFIHNAETTDHSPQEWDRLFVQTIQDLHTVGSTRTLFSDGNITEQRVGAGITATAIALAGYPHAKEWLIANGMDRERVEKMAVGQVIAIYTERIYRRFADDWEAVWQVPFPQAMDLMRRLNQKLDTARPFGSGEDREVLPLVSLLLPALEAGRSAQ